MPRGLLRIRPGIFDFEPDSETFCEGPGVVAGLRLPKLSQGKPRPVKPRGTDLPGMETIFEEGGSTRIPR